MWTLAPNDDDPIAWPTNHLRKTMMMILFGVNGIALIDTSLEEAKLSLEHFKENIIKELDLIAYPPRRKRHATRMSLHSDRYPIHNTRTTAQTMAECEQSRRRRVSSPGTPGGPASSSASIGASRTLSSPTGRFFADPG
jgi:hypothetical protein